MGHSHAQLKRVQVTAMRSPEQAHKHSLFFLASCRVRWVSDPAHVHPPGEQTTAGSANHGASQTIGNSEDGGSCFKKKETLTREGHWTATPNRAVRSELPRGRDVGYYRHESLHDLLTVNVPRHA